MIYVSLQFFISKISQVKSYVNLKPVIVRLVKNV